MEGCVKDSASDRENGVPGGNVAEKIRQHPMQISISDIRPCLEIGGWTELSLN
jgi:hypothetical protein